MEQDKKTRILELAAEKKTVSEIKEILKIPRYQINQIINPSLIETKAQVKPARKLIRYNSPEGRERLKNIISLANEGKSRQDIKELLGISSQSLSDILRRSQDKDLKIKIGRKEINYKLMKEMIESGKKDAYITEELSCAKATVINYRTQVLHKFNDLNGRGRTPYAIKTRFRLIKEGEQMKRKLYEMEKQLEVDFLMADPEWKADLNYLLDIVKEVNQNIKDRNESYMNQINIWRQSKDNRVKERMGISIKPQV